MERMKHTGDYELDEINMLEQECADLEEDNKRLEEENKKLKKELELVRKNTRANVETLDNMY
jgi:cell division protein FtsB